MWPKIITVRGIAIQVETPDELDEIIQRYGVDTAMPPLGLEALGKSTKKHPAGTLARNDRILLGQFVERETKGVLNKDLGQFFGARGKAIGPALRKWGVHIGLAGNETSQAFERFNRPDGRGYRLSTPFLQVAKTLLKEQE